MRKNNKPYWMKTWKKLKYLLSSGPGLCFDTLVSQIKPLSITNKRLLNLSAKSSEIFTIINFCYETSGFLVFT